MCRLQKCFAILVFAAVLPIVSSGSEFVFPQGTITVPEGFTVEVAAEAPLVHHPMMACFDERGRLFITEASGTNGPMEVLEKIKPNFIRRMEDTDGDGRFDKSTLFADRLQIPNGALWWNGSLYVAEPPGLWKFTDTDDDGIADVREHLAGKVRSNGMSSTLHGPVLGPTGRLYWCGGQSGYSLDKETEPPPGRMAPGVFSLRTDGREHEIFAVGGQANPVEITFGPEGEMFGTVALLDQNDGTRHDALMHWTYGGIYATNPNDPLPLKESGPRLPALRRVGQVAPAGITRYRSSHFGPAYQDNLFWAQLNTRKIIRTQLRRQGATFTAQDEDFLTSNNVNFHATDVLEDADGSLLVLDTGSWFHWGCPTSQLARPEVKGAIYRVRKANTRSVDDPRGLRLDWEKATPAQLIAWLDDPRPAVTERAISALVAKEGRAIKASLEALRQPKSTQTKQNLVWALSRIRSENAAQILRLALEDTDVRVRQAAVCAVGMERDAKAVAQLLKLVVHDPQPSIRREAATALGRLRDATAVPKLLEALHPPADAFLTHALVYALMQIGQVELTAAGLQDANARTQRGALLALSQMENASLSRGQLLLLLQADDRELRQAAFTVASRNPDMTDDLAIILRDWLRKKDAGEDHFTFWQTAALKMATNALLQKVMGETLTEKETPTPLRLLLLETIKRAPVQPLPSAWLAALAQELTCNEPAVQLAATAVLQERRIPELDETLTALAKNEKQAAPLRLAWLTALAPRLSPVESELFIFLQQQLQSEADPLLRLQTARTLSTLSLSHAQLQKIAEMLPKVNPAILPTLLRAFTHSTDETTGLALLAGLSATPATAQIAPGELARLFQSYPAPVQNRAKPLLQKWGADWEQPQKPLETLWTASQGGDFNRGRAVFFGRQAACFNCHRINGQGGLIGPDLSQIAKIRTGRDLLESMVFPSASIVPGYQPFTLETEDGQVYRGLMTQQTPEAIWLRGPDLVEHKIEQLRIKFFQEATASIMPAGLAERLTSEELRDLLAFMQGLKDCQP